MGGLEFKWSGTGRERHREHKRERRQGRYVRGRWGTASRTAMSPLASTWFSPAASMCPRALSSLVSKLQTCTNPAYQNAVGIGLPLLHFDALLQVFTFYLFQAGVYTDRTTWLRAFIFYCYVIFPLRFLEMYVVRCFRRFVALLQTFCSAFIYFVASGGHRALEW